MKVSVYYDGNDIHDYCISQFAKGVSREHSVFHKKLGDYEPADIAVVFGMYKRAVPLSWPRGVVLDKQKERGGTCVVLDSGYVGRGDGPNDHYMVGLNGLNGRAEFRNRGMPPDRREKLDIELKPWKRDGGYIVLCGQVAHDASVQHVNIFQWYAVMAKEIPKHTARHVIFRPHPKDKRAPKGIPVSKASFEEDCARAKCFVTFNSNVAVLAAIEGVPVFAFDQGSMALRIANTDLQYIENPYLPEREPWLNDLAYCQWTPNEMADGLTWQHLFASS